MKKLMVMAAILGGIASVQAHADGFIAGTLRDLGVINEQQRKAVDRAHEAAGKPLDQVPQKVLESLMRR